MREEAIIGCLLGTAVCDALGLPSEGLSRDRQRRMFPDLSRHHLLPGRGMVSDDSGETTYQFADTLSLSRGVSGYVYHTVPVVLQTWLRHQDDWAGGVGEIIRCGGDTDTTAAIVGALIGARVGRDGIPQDLLTGLWEWPHGVAWMEELGRRLADVLENQRPCPCPPAWWTLPRNLLFLLIIMTHGFRRLLPPY